MLGGGTAIISILNCVCAYVNAYPHLETCVLMSMLGGGTATISMYYWTTSVCAYVNDWRWCNHNPYLETCVCVCPCQCLVEDLLGTTVESLLTDTPNKGHCIKYLSTMDTTKSPNFNPPINIMQLESLKTGQSLYSGQTTWIYIGPKVSFIRRLHCIKERCTAFLRGIVHNWRYSIKKNYNSIINSSILIHLLKAHIKEH